MLNPTAAIIAQASTSQLKEYLLGFTKDAAILTVELMKRGESAQQVITDLEKELQPRQRHAVVMPGADRPSSRNFSPIRTKTRHPPSACVPLKGNRFTVPGEDITDHAEREYSAFPCKLRTINRLQQRRIRREQRRKLPVSIQKRNAQVLRHCGLPISPRTGNWAGAVEARRSASKGLSRLDSGIERFKASRGNRFSSYAIRLATGRIQHFRRDRVRCLRIPWRLDALHVTIRLQSSAPMPSAPFVGSTTGINTGVSLERWREARIGHQHHHLISLINPAAEIAIPATRMGTSP